MILFVVFNLLVLGLLIASKWLFFSKQKKKRSFRSSLLIWAAFFPIAVLSLWSYIGNLDFLIFFALPFLALFRLFDPSMIGFWTVLILFLFAFFFPPLWLSKKSREFRPFFWNYCLLHLFLYFSLLPGVLLAFAQLSFYGQGSPGIRDPWVWHFLLYFPGFWFIGLFDALLSARSFWKGVRVKGGG